MRKKHFIIVVFLFCILFISACSEKPTESQSSEKKPAESQSSGSSTTAKTEKKDKKEEGQKNKGSKEQSVKELLAELPAPTKTVIELANANPGSFSGKKYAELTSERKQEVIEEFSKLPKIGENPSEEEIELYWRKALVLFHEDYPNPTEVIEQLAVESFGSPEIEDERYQFKEQLNVQIILDSSGSMGNLINGKTMMDIAKESIKEFASSLPKDANIALRVYGHKGSGSNKDKELSCKSNELVYKLKTYDPQALNDSLNKFKPVGWTPLAKAIEEAKNDLIQYKGENNTNIIYLVSDGIETCGGDPVTEAKKLADSDIQPIVNVIGFDVDSKGQQQLKEVATAAKGIYSNARNQEELKKELEKAQGIAEKWEEWKDNALTTASNEKWDKKLSDIPRFGLDWSYAFNSEQTNIEASLMELKEMGHISHKAYQLLDERVWKRFRNGMELGKHLEKDLRNLADQSYEQIKEEINKKYNDNTK